MFAKATDMWFVCRYTEQLGYEPADLTVYPPPPTNNCRGWVYYFSYRCLVFQKNVLKGKPEYFRVI